MSRVIPRIQSIDDLRSFVRGAPAGGASRSEFMQGAAPLLYWTFQYYDILLPEWGASDPTNQNVTQLLPGQRPLEFLRIESLASNRVGVIIGPQNIENEVSLAGTEPRRGLTVLLPSQSLLIHTETENPELGIELFDGSQIYALTEPPAVIGMEGRARVFVTAAYRDQRR